MRSAAPPPPKRPGRPANPDHCARRREDILDAAVQLFARRGFAAADMQELADNAGVGKGTLYRYFPSKDELFLAAADRVMVRMRAEVDRATVGVDEPLDRIQKAIRAFLEFFAERPERVEMLIQERAHFKDRKKPTFIQHREVNVVRWRDLYADLIRQGRIRPMAVERITDVIGDLLYGTIFTNYFAGLRKPLDVQAEDIIDVVFAGILSGPERQRRAARGAAVANGAPPSERRSS
jgi:AcrR family transcriptional regulator